MLKTLIKVSLWVLAFVPLVLDNKVFFPYTSGKNLLIEIALVLVGLLITTYFFVSRSFREEITEKCLRYIKSPLVLSVLAFLILFILSTIFAVDKYSALWGDLSRAEGLAGISFFVSFFVFGLFIFEKRDWLWFFKLGLLTSLILLGKEFWEFFGQHISRPESFTGNPTFLAGYLLFSITSSLFVFNEDKNKVWRILSVIILISSVVGIFIAQTRGTILGLGLGLIVTLIYCAFKGRNISYKKLNLQKISIALLCLGIIFSGLFVLTRKNEVWQKIPGLSRIAITNTDGTRDISTAVRLSLYKSSLQSINPNLNNWSKFLVGWGPDNYILASSKYYDVSLYSYELVLHDRAHNKLLDVLAMNGLLGLLAYLSIWFFFFTLIIRGFKNEFSLINVGLLFFSISFLTHLMFVFDQISTSVAFFSILAFYVYFTTAVPPQALKKPLIALMARNKYEILIGLFLVIQAVFLGFIFFKSTLPGYLQMRNYTALIQNATSSDFEIKIKSSFSPNTLAQMNIRKNFLELTNGFYNKNPDERNLRLLKLAMEKSEEYIEDHEFDFSFMTILAGLYTLKGEPLKNPDYLKRGEELLRQVLAFAPNRPDTKQRLAVNLFYEKKYLEAFNMYERLFDDYPEVLDSDRNRFEVVYSGLIKYFYLEKDKENFIKTVDRLRANSYAQMAPLDQIIQNLNAKGVWPKVDFK